jgi:hypothetical protein
LTPASGQQPAVSFVSLVMTERAARRRLKKVVADEEIVLGANIDHQT